MSWLLSNGTEEFREEERRHAVSDGDDARDVADVADVADVRMIECPCCGALFPVFVDDVA